MDSSSITMSLILALLLLLSAYFSATETAVTSFNKARMKNRAEEGNKRARLALHLVEEYDKLLSCILIANNIVNLTAATLATILFVRHFPVYGPTISTIVLTCLVLIFGEITPKALAKDQPERFAMFSAPILRVFLFLLTPLNAFFRLFYRLAKKLVRNSENDGITEEELITMVTEAEHEGGLEPHESQLIRAAIEFNDLEVAEILIPRVDIVAVEANVTSEELAAAFAESGYSRIPVYQGTIDNIVGVIHEKDFYAARARNVQSFIELAGEVLYTTENTKISVLLRLLQRSKTHMAIVVDEYGGTQGLVTLEDILEELVGEIWDEHDEVLEEFKALDDGSYLISCSADLDDLFDRFSIRGDLSDSASISGWVLEQLGQVPAEGDHFIYENMDVTITRVDNRRVLEIHVSLLPVESED
ncbi:MAG: transporter [Firmicutes bacterium]|nr:transporter [Bacillota bacterium]